VSVFDRFRTGWGAFRDAWVNADPQQQQQGGLGEFDAYSRWEARQTRYDLYWAMWQSNAFRDLAHYWSPSLKHAFGLYRHTRNIFNPVNRLVEFHVAHLMGGRLDRAAGDGEKERSALPILTENDAIRPAIAKLWRDGKWQEEKSVWTRFGACLGDAALAVDDDPDRKRVTLRVIHPGHLKWVDFDSAGNVLSYIIEQWRYDPRGVPIRNLNPTVDPRSTRTMVRYNEEAFVDPGTGRVVYRTYLDGGLFNWRGATVDGAELPAEWHAPYRFIPLVLAKHQSIGLPWGVAEPHSLISKALEVDDMASGLGDQIRKRIRAPKLLAGMIGPGMGAAAAAAPTGAGGGPPFGRAPQGPGSSGSGTFGGVAGEPLWSQRGREEMPFLYGPADAKVFDLTNDLDVPGVTGLIQAIVEEIERDFPELQMDVWASGDVSGRALRVARQRTEVKVQERRSGYDAALVMAQKMAMAIGGMRGCPGYEGLDFDPREPGPLDHAIGHRPVFSPDPMDDVEEGQAFWTMVGAAVSAGMPLELVLKREGWGAVDVAELVDARAGRGVAGTPA
jgi:hypothetical protein